MSTPGRDEPAGETAAPARARDTWSRGADAAWSLARRIHLGTRKPANWAQLLRFGVVGGSGYVINLVAFTVLSQVVELHHIAAAVGAFAVAITNNFLLNRQWTFRADRDGRHPAHQGARFLAVSVVGLGVNLAVLELLVSGVALAEVPSQAVAVAVAMPVNFIGNKLWTFG